MGRIYVKNFTEVITEDDFRQFFHQWNDDIGKIDIVTKKDENEEIISRFCYLTVADESVLNK